MVQKQQAPGALGKHAGAFTQIHHEGKDYFLSRSEYRVYSLLMEGGKPSTFDISDRLHISDPRSAIRCLRNKGIHIADMWCFREYGVRFKRYFIHNHAA